MSRFNLTDLKLTESGDLVLSPNGDLSLVSDYKFMIQQVRNRLKTTNPDWFYDLIGADLEDLLGLPNNEETALRGAELIKKALTYDGLLNHDDVYVRSASIDRDRILFFVFINHPGIEEPLGFTVELDLAGGCTVRRI